MDKASLLRRVLEQLAERQDRLEQAFAESRSYATDPDSKAEGKYDTRGLEASYLAAGQAEEVERIAGARAALEGLALPDYDETQSIGSGALVEADRAGELVFYLLLPGGIGLVTEHLGCELGVLTPDTPLYQLLLGSRIGDVLDKQGITILDQW